MTPPLAPTIQVLYEDAMLLAVAKPSGMVTHPAYRQPDGTLTDAVFARQAARGEARPWLLHRLDRATSGVVLFAKTEVARRVLVRQFERHTLRKQYLALVEGTLTPPMGEIDAPLKRDPLDRRRVIVAADGQPALTRYRVLGASALAGATYALVMMEPVTGRTHQIRAHLAARGAAILGDATYRALATAATGPGVGAAQVEATGMAPDGAGVSNVTAPRVMLHAWRLTCRYPQPTLPTPASSSPDTSPAPFVVTAPLPTDLLALIGQLGLGDALAHLQD
ncbi:MAG TPA: RluA family pseudouridine synthase [Ktedonobacterales bacterium]|nr:RluA family pseudouridine synthase [Ktedonobacterales bacterium]